MIDWHQGTIRASAEHVAGELLHAYGLFSQLEPTKARFNYHRGAQIVVKAEPKISLFHGGNGGGVHFLASGHNAQKSFDIIRELFPEHSISRLDDCIDYVADQAFETLKSIALAVAEKYRLKVYCAGDWITGDNGRTLYIGSEKSQYRIRLYEKGKKEGKDPDWVRCELQVRPKSSKKSGMAQLHPQEVWGSSRWTHDLSKRLGNTDLERTYIPNIEKVHTPEYWLVRNYGRLLATMLEQTGSPEALGQRIASLLARHRNSHEETS